AWSPDGNFIAFVMAGGGKARIAKLNVGSNKIDILSAGGSDAIGNSTNFDPTWSPDSKRIAFSSTRPESASSGAGGRHIFAIGLPCRECQTGCPPAFQLTIGRVDDSQPEWSPDGSSVVFVRTKGGKKQLFKIDPSRPEGSNNPAEPINAGNANDDDPAWNP